MAPQQGAGAGELEAAQVRSMFDGIAWVYDALNSAMTAGLHHRWRTRAVDLAHVGPGSRVLDVASGTGDLALELARRVAPGGEVVGSDFSEGMLARARIKAAKVSRQVGPAGAELRFEWGDALKLPYADDSFDAATVGFGARNFSDLGRGLGEMARVVRPGGRVIVLEFTTPKRLPLSLFYRVWFDRVVPLLGLLVGGAEGALARLRPSRASAREVGLADAYNYLPNSVKRWPGPEQLAVEMRQAGIVQVGCLLTAGGIVAIHTGIVPPNGA
ncbi:MAG TPA: ubiquinone/menaquinone biosynthesis methyltransferase [Solirubrobacteraceae bacterium]|jgi:demethylmenaquinone methyltransferase/2-methoxy-6-polyprenyl-1,4-benzoquinol methylase